MLGFLCETLVKGHRMFDLCEPQILEMRVKRHNNILYKCTYKISNLATSTTIKRKYSLKVDSVKLNSDLDRSVPTPSMIAPSGNLESLGRESEQWS